MNILGRTISEKDIVELSRIFARLDARMNLINERLDVVNQRIDVINERLELRKPND